MTEAFSWVGWFNHPLLLPALIVLNIPIYKLFGKLLFGDSEDFKEAIGYWFTPDIVSLFRGEWREDQWAEIKICVFIGSCAITIAAEYKGISKFIAWALA